MTVAQFRILRLIYLTDPHFSRIPIPLQTTEVRGKDYGQTEDMAEFGRIKVTVESWVEKQNKIDPDQELAEVIVNGKVHRLDWPRFTDCWNAISQQEYNKHVTPPKEIYPI